MGADKQKTILLVDDEAIIAMSEKTALEKYGYAVITALSGEQAVTMVATTPAIDLILMDINLGAGMDGTDAAAIILKNQDIPVVFLSSHMEPEVVEKTEKITSYGYVVKDSSITVLDASIKMAFKLFEAKTKEKEKETRLEAAFAALHESEVRFRRISSITSDIAYSCHTNEDGFFFIDWMTGAAERITGYSSEEIKEKGCWRFLVVEEDLALFEENVIGLALGSQGSCELRIRHKNGGIVWIASFAECVSAPQTPARLFIYGGLIDISKRKQAEETYRNIFLNAQTGLFRTEIKTGLLLDANDCVARFIGYKDRQELLAKPFNIAESYVDSKDRQRMVSLLEERGEFNNFEARFKRNDGSIAWMRYAAKIVPEKGWIDGVSEDITKEKAMEASLRESEEKYRILIENSHDIIYTLSLDGIFTFVSPSWTTLLGHPLNQVVGKPFQQFVHADDLAACMTLLQKVMQTGQRQNGMDAYRVRHADGSWRWHVTNAVPIRDATGTIVGGEGIARDITERMQAEGELKKSEDKFRAIFDNASDGMFVVDLKTRKFVMCNAMCAKMLGYNQEDFSNLDIADIHPGEDLPFIYEQIGKFSRGEEGIRSDIKFKRKNGSVFASDLSPALLTITEDECLLISFKDITERKRVEQELRESKTLTDAVVENVPLMIFLKEATDLRFVIFNRAGEELLGYDRKALLGKNNLDLFPPEQAAHFMAKDREVLDGEAGMLDIPEESILTAKKGTRLLHTQKVCIQGTDGKTKYLLGISEDITERKQVEFQMKAALEALKVSEARSQALLSAIPDMLFRVNRQGVFLDYKADVKDLYAQSEPSIIGKRYRDILPPEFADLIDLKIRATLDTGMLQTFEYRLPVPVRGVRDYEARMVASGADEVTAIIRDITERKQDEAALQKSELQLKAMLDNSPVVVLLIQGGNLTYLNPAAEKMTGWKMEEFLGKSFTNFVHKDDIEIVIKNNRERMGGNSLLAPYIIKINKKTGGFIYAEVNGTVIDLDGKPTMLGFLSDITERKQAEEEIKRQLSEKETLLKEVHHRIKNNIASIGGLISLRMQSISNSEAIAVLRDASSRVDSMRILYDKLLLTEDYEDLSVKNYLDDLIDTIIAMFPGQVKITVKKSITDFHLDSKRLFPLGIIINELLTNKMKYAFVNKDTGIIKISLTKADNHVALTIQDNGNELPAGFDINKTKGFGLTLVKMLSQQLGGSFSMEKAAGTRCKVEFDI